MRNAMLNLPIDQLGGVDVTVYFDTDLARGHMAHVDGVKSRRVASSPNMPELRALH
jgi:hypothetical protein